MLLQRAAGDSARWIPGAAKDPANWAYPTLSTTILLQVSRNPQPVPAYCADR